MEGGKSRGLEIVHILFPNLIESMLNVRSTVTNKLFCPPSPNCYGIFFDSIPNLNRNSESTLPDL